MGQVLPSHQAGEAITTTPEELFRRETDRFIKKELRKTPLDVGADRIARTAHSALRLLGHLRAELGLPLPLAWDRPVRGVSVIEVYPAATLLTRGHSARRYKTPDQRQERESILELLREEVLFECIDSSVKEDADVLDAVICAVAAKDFLDGRALSPQDLKLARKEGWIWAKPLLVH